MTDNEAIIRLDKLCQKVTELRGKALFVLYYPDGYGTMLQPDVQDAYSELRKAGYSKERKIGNLEVLLNTYGGDPVAAYRLAQMIRDFADELIFLVPEHAYSAGTLTCFAGNEIRLGDYAGLSPIDITLAEASSSEREEVELTSVDYFMEFAREAREGIERCLQRIGSKNTSSVDSDLLVKMVEQVTALKVGKYFRERTLTGHYAEELLDTYMFGRVPNSEDRRNRVINGLLFRAPAHEFHLDYHLCKKMELEVKEMSVDESDLTKSIVELLRDLTKSGIICQNLSDSLKMPFIRFYPVLESVTQEKENDNGKKVKGTRNTKETS